MGGNAIKNVTTRRYSKSEYMDYFVKISKEFKKIFGKDVVQLIPAYGQKESFGDMDLIFYPDDFNIAVRKIIKHYHLTQNQWARNTGILSFAPDDFQIDLIYTERHNVSAALMYFAYNDMSNLLGRLTHKLGIKLGHKGLSIVLRSPNNPSQFLREITLSNNYYAGLDILGLSIPRYMEGFDTLEEIFEYVASSKYFNKDAFLLDNRNHIARTRDHKRPTYTKFLQWIIETQPKDNFVFDKTDSKGGYNLREPFFHDVILPRYPSVEYEIIGIIEEDLVNQNFKKYFNGGVVSYLSGLEGRELGMLMSKIEFSDLERHMINDEMVKVKVSEKL